MQKCIGGTGNFFQNPPKKKQIDVHLRKLMHPLLHFIIVFIGILSMSTQEVSLIMYLCSLPFCLLSWFNETVHVCAFRFFFYENYLIFTLKPGLEVNLLVHLQSFASKIFFH